MNAHGDSAEAQRKVQEGRDLRSEGRVEDGKAPKTTEPAPVTSNAKLTNRPRSTAGGPPPLSLGRLPLHARTFARLGSSFMPGARRREWHEAMAPLPGETSMIAMDLPGFGAPQLLLGH